MLVRLSGRLINMGFVKDRSDVTSCSVAGEAEAVSVITGALVSALKPPILWNVLRNDFPLYTFVINL